MSQKKMNYTARLLQARLAPLSIVHYFEMALFEVLKVISTIQKDSFKCTGSKQIRLYK